MDGPAIHNKYSEAVAGGDEPSVTDSDSDYSKAASSCPPLWCLLGSLLALLAATTIVVVLLCCISSHRENTTSTVSSSPEGSTTMIPGGGFTMVPALAAEQILQQAKNYGYQQLQFFEQVTEVSMGFSSYHGIVCTMSAEFL